jgi:hypothetical protein
MSKNAVPVIDAETQQFHDDLLQSVREFKALCLNSITHNQSRSVDEIDVVQSLNERQLSK